MFVEFSHMEKKDFPCVILSNILEAFHLQGLCLMLGISALLITRPGRCDLMLYIREGCKKSKWKFKMAFPIKGGGLKGVSFAIKLF